MGNLGQSALNPWPIRHLVSERTPNPAPTDAKAESPRPKRRAWDDVPLRQKLVLLIAAACVWGAVVGVAVAHWQWSVWVIIAGIALVATALGRVAHAWAAAPVEDLAYRLERVARPDRPTTTNQLPSGRADELGRVYRAVRKIAAHASRDRQEATRLRRNLDSSIAEATRRATVQLSQLAMRDPLTNLGNRRFLDKHLDALVRSCAQADTDLVAVAIDLDNFKAVNDELGHAAGDELIVFAATLIRGSVRDDDVAIRMGGDEFVVLMPGCELDRAAAFVDRLRKLFTEHVRMTLPHEPQPNLSAGIASLLRDRARDGAALIEAADRYLYRAKRRGKAQTAGF